ncbi:MAG: ATP-binding protein [bacterium]|nr:ATP-binding protein [bacterium]MDT8365678.1 ATP-binding protein [bacterium]
MSRKRLIYRLLPTYLLVMALALAGVLWLGAREMTRFFYSQKSNDLQSMAYAAARSAVATLETEDFLDTNPKLSSWCSDFAVRTSTRVTVVLSSGRVLCDSDEDPGKMDDHSTRPEIKKAIGGAAGSSIRYSYTLEKPLMYVAVPMEGPSNIVVIMRVAVPVSTMTQALWSVRLRLTLGVMAAGLLIVITTVLLSRRITSPLREMRDGVRRYADGDFGTRLRFSSTEEFAELAEEMNSMARQLDDRIRTVVNQRNELEAVLSSMVEGVLAFDTSENLISLNQAASDLLGVRHETALNRPIQEVIRNSALQRFVSKTLGSMEPVEDEISLYSGGERSLQAHGAPLTDVSGKRIGTLVVLNDVTNIRRLENIRREFVANASHEIRTPITSIKGFVETLLDGALEDQETARRFLGIIGKHSDRLNAIVEDLLSLSKIEMEAETGQVYLEEGRIREVIEEAVEACHTGIEEKEINVEINCPGELMCPINPSLLVQALINLLDNAVKFSGTGGTVTVQCRAADGGVMVSVKDEGAGIEAVHIPRLFERFYRVDKARSRTLGGTGLGLAIVKHIAQVHNGEVSVTSRPGKGSTFTITLPS